jgi:hypothetical protein
MHAPLITNPKLIGLEPRWAPFRGISLLFVNPASKADAGLYRTLQEGLAGLEHDELITKKLFRLLPVTTHHVTVWDGINDGNLPQVVPGYRPAWERFLDEIPNPASPDDLLREVLESELLTRQDWGLRLRCEQIENWSNISLVARLGPADEISETNLQQLIAARDALSDIFEARFCVRPHPCYTPHITLGYFANDERAQTTGADVERWNIEILKRMNGQILPLQRILPSLFQDMTSFCDEEHC